MRSKKAEGGAHVASLILIMTLLLSLYILFVPPSERQKILEGTTSTGGGSSGAGKTSGLNSSVLLAVHPGKLSYLQNKEFEHVIPPFYLFKSTESTVLKDINTLRVSRSAFGEDHPRNVTLRLDDLASLDNILLSFEPETAVGILTIELNGETIFESEITQQSVEPVKLPKDLLKTDNLFVFRVSDPGWKFWQANTYNLAKVKIVGDRTNAAKQQSTNIFFVSPEERPNIESSVLTFLPKCEKEQAGKLQVTINGNVVYAEVADCAVETRVQFSPQILIEGNNNVVFHTDEGSYFIEQIKIKDKLGEDASVVYHFDLNSTQMASIKRSQRRITLVIEFVDDQKDNEGDLAINGHRTGFFTHDRIYEKPIDAYVQEGGNAIRLIPKRTMDISNLYVKFK